MAASTQGQPEQVRQLEIVARCPHCGGETRWRLLQRLNTCPFCDSALFWPQEPGAPSSLVAEDRLADPDALLDAVLTLDALSQWAALMNAARQGRQEEDLPALYELEEPDGARLEEIKRRRRGLFRLCQDRPVFAPYLLLSATLAYHALGRVSPADRKVYESLFFVAEEVLPAYPPPWNFRDRGLWTSQGHLRPMTEDVLLRGPLLPPAQGEPAVGETLRRWSANRHLLERDMDPVAFASGTFALRRWLLFRPFHFAEMDTPEGRRWFLLDGQFGTVAGYPTAEEVTGVLGGGWSALAPSALRPPDIRVLAFRCPGCGWDLKASLRTEAQFCTNCGRILQPTEEGLQELPYAFVELPWPAPAGGAGAGRVFLPFWRFEGTFTLEGRCVPGARELLALALPDVARSLPPQWGPALFLPAFDALTWQKYDAFAFEAARMLTSAGAQRTEGRLIETEPLGVEGGVVLPVVPYGPFADGMARLLPGLLPPALQRILFPPALRRLQGATFSPRSADLVLVPVPLSAEEPPFLQAGPVRVAWPPLRDGSMAPALWRSAKRWLTAGAAGHGA